MTYSRQFFAVLKNLSALRRAMFETVARSCLACIAENRRTF